MTDFESIRQQLQPELSQFEQSLAENCRSSVELTNAILEHILELGGKRLRPVIHLLCSRLLEARGDGPILIATILEYMHTATLLHDDVVDESTMRRGERAAHTQWGNAASILAGDYLYSRAFELINRCNNMAVVDVLATATTRVAEGEMFQLSLRGNPDITEMDYLKVITEKTGRLFEAAAELSCFHHDNQQAHRSSLAQFGLNFGVAFQLMDDWLDYQGSPDDLGKNLGDDLADGLVTLPLIHALQHAEPAQATILRAAITSNKPSNFTDIAQTLEQTGALSYTLQRAEQYAKHACDALEPFSGAAKDSLLKLVSLSLSRRH